MKKLVALLLICFLLPSVALADSIDLSALSFDELVQLRQQIAQELTTRPEWKEVTVPIGIWKVGEDIPAGHWTISASSGNAPWVIIGSVLDANGKEIDSWNSSLHGVYYKAELESPSYIFYKESKSISSVDFELRDGLYVEIKYASVIFSPYAGKPSLGF